jgi:hypothetical protein
MQTTISDFARLLQAVMEPRLLRTQTREQTLSPQIQITSKHQFLTLERRDQR